MAPRHIGHGSHVVYRSQPVSWKAPSSWQASRMTTIWAWAVGSLVKVTRFAPSATTLPSFTTTAANGPPPDRTLATASAIAWRMISGDIFSGLSTLRVHPRRTIRNERVLGANGGAGATKS